MTPVSVSHKIKSVAILTVRIEFTYGSISIIVVYIADTFLIQKNSGKMLYGPLYIVLIALPIVVLIALHIVVLIVNHHCSSLG